LTEQAFHSRIESMSIDASFSLKELEDALSQDPDADTMRAACEGMDRRREEIQKRVGTVDAAVEFVRNFRDQ